MQSSSQGKRVEPWSCAVACIDSETGATDDWNRAARACVLPGLPPVQPNDDLPGRWSTYHGRRAVTLDTVRREHPSLTLYPGIERTPPEARDDGCPGAWYRTDFARSLVPYLRRRTQHGRDESLRLRDEDDPLILDAVAYFEGEQDRCESYYAEIRASAQEARAK